MKKYFVKALLILAFISAVSYAQQYDLSKQKVLYVNGYSHLDTQWRWDFKTTINKYIWNTLERNFYLIQKYPDYIINFPGSNRYRMMKEYYPEQYDSLKQYIAQGRWFPCGSSVEENDVLSPSAESTIRQVLYGNEFFRNEFKTTSYEFMLPDCFGFPASLPSVLAHCGLKGFSTQKLSWGSAVGIPFNVGRWIGPDNEYVVAAFDPKAYGSRIRHDLSKDTMWINRINKLGKNSGVYTDYMYYGTGDMGGAPTENSVKWLETALADSTNIKVVSAKADQMFVDLTSGQKSRLPEYKGELLLTNHSAGSLTSAAYPKRWNRKNELLAFNAEASSLMGSRFGGINYDQTRLNEAWRLVLSSQFHDMLPGTITPTAFEYLWNDQILAANQLSNIFANASISVINAMDTQGKGIPVSVFNPLPVERQDMVEATVVFEGKIPENIRVFDNKGKEVPSQVKSVSGNKLTVLFLASVPSMSYTSFDVRPAKSQCLLSTGLNVTQSTLENTKYLVKIDAQGDISSIYDKTEKKELLSSPVRLAFQYERPQEWPAWNMDWQDRKNPPAGYVDGPAKIKIIENGPARVAITVEREARNSKFIQEIRLAAGGAGDRVELKTKIDWATQKHSLKATFPLTVSNPIATYNGDIGTVTRGNNDSLKFEVPSHKWFDLTDKSRNYGVSILEDCKNGSDKPSDNMLRLTLLYTPDIHDQYKDQAYQDLGKHDILYAVYGHKGDWREANSNWAGARLNQPLVAFQTVSHKGTLGKSFSFLKINNPDIEVLALKKAENSNDMVLRIAETKGNALKNVEISLASPIISAEETNGQEIDIKPAIVKNGKLVFDENPYHLRTFRLTLKPYGKSPSLPKYTAMKLPYNADVISYDKNKKDGSFDAHGITYPAEMLPDTVKSENVSFVLGPKADNQNNAVACDGQTIKLPKVGKFNAVYILAASSDSISNASFKVTDRALNLTVNNWSGFFGQWDKRIWDRKDTSETNFSWNGFKYLGIKPGYVRKDNVAFFTTHRHLSSGKNDTYEYAYLYKYRISLPENAKEIVLPFNKNIKIFAMTAAYDNNDKTYAAQSLSDTLDNNNGYERFEAANIISGEIKRDN